MKLWNDCSNKEKIERWQNALRVLKSLTPHQRRKHFNMANWGVKTECGTVAGIVDRAALIPTTEWLQASALELVNRMIEVKA